MKNILIIEDEVVIASWLKGIVNSIDDSINVFTTGYAAEAVTISMEYSIDIFVIDIHLKDYSGFDLAKQLREMNRYKITPILFSTSNWSKELLSFREIHCYDYIKKPYTEDQVRKALQTIIKYGIKNEDVEEKEKFLRIKMKGFYILLNQSDVIYIEASLRKVMIVTKMERISCHQTLKNIQDELSDDFVQCHRSCIINKKYVKNVDLKNGNISFNGIEDHILLGSKYKDEVLKTLNSEYKNVVDGI